MKNTDVKPGMVFRSLSKGDTHRRIEIVAVSDHYACTKNVDTGRAGSVALDALTGQSTFEHGPQKTQKRWELAK